jgi:hypothetical protein
MKKQEARLPRVPPRPWRTVSQAVGGGTKSVGSRGDDRLASAAAALAVSMDRREEGEVAQFELVIRASLATLTKVLVTG